MLYCHYAELFPFLRMASAGLPLTDPVYARIITFPVKIEIEGRPFSKLARTKSRMTGSETLL